MTTAAPRSSARLTAALSASGTRTASVTGGFIALALGLHKLAEQGRLLVPSTDENGAPRGPLRDQVAAVSVGHVGGDILVDLDYSEDSRARVDLNLVATATGAVVEVQGTAEGEAVPRPALDSLLDAAAAGVATLCQRQRQVLVAAGVDLARLGLVAP